MSIKATYEKLEFSVGLSTNGTIMYRSPDEKYQLADKLDALLNMEVKFCKESSAIEIDGTSIDMLGISPLRLQCHGFIARLPESALAEAIEELTELSEHYRAFERAEAMKAQYLPSPKAVTVKVNEVIKL